MCWSLLGCAVLCCAVLSRNDFCWAVLCWEEKSLAQLHKQTLCWWISLAELGLRPRKYTVVLRSFIFSCNTGWKQPLLSLCSTHSVIPYFSSFSALSLTCTNIVPPFLLLCAASSPARQITIQRPAVPPKSVVTDSHYTVYLCERGGRHALTIFKSGATTSPP